RRWSKTVAAITNPDELRIIVNRVRERRSRRDDPAVATAGAGAPRVELVIPDAGPVISAAMECIRGAGLDRHLEHAVMHLLIQVDARKPTVEFLRDPSPQVRRAALIALDQMDDGNLQREQVIPLLDTDDPQVRKAALAVINSRNGWATELVELLRGWLAEKQPSDEHLSLLRGTLVAQARGPATHKIVGTTLLP